MNKPSKDIEKKDQNLFDNISIKYAKKDIHPVRKMVRKYRMNLLFDFLKETFNKKEYNSAIEIGCRSGANAYYASPYIESYTGIDYSKKLVSIAQKLYQTENISFVQANAKNFKSEYSYDLIFGIGILHHITEINKVLENVKKLDIVKPFLNQKRSEAFPGTPNF
ncbi:MAG: class I SAM-dependent methyltransferase [bacterium]